MSGGGSSNKKADKKAEPVVPGTSPLMTQPAFMPGNQNALAEQLAAGSYGSMPDIMQMLTQTFTPMQVLDTRPPPAPTTPAPVAPTPKPPKPSRPTLPGRNQGNGARGSFLNNRRYSGGRDG